MRWALGFEARVALRFLREGRMQTLLIVVGVAAGVAVVAYISALVTGLQSNTLVRTLGAQAHITVRTSQDLVTPAAVPEPGVVRLPQAQPRAQRLRSLANWQSVVPVLEAEPAVEAVSPQVAGSGLALRGEASLAVALTGVELDRYDRIVGLRQKVVAGRARLDPGEAIVGLELASDLGLRVGDRLLVQTTLASESMRVTALVDMGLRDLNRRTVIVPLRTAQNLLGLPGGATGIDLALRDVWTAREVAGQLRQRLPFRIESWQENNAQLVSALNAQSISTLLIRAVVLVVVVLGIASVLVVSVVQKRREIGILRAMGATRGQVLRVFLVQGAVVAAAGSASGLLLAIAMIAAFTRFVRGSDGLPLFDISLQPQTAWEVAAIAMACGVLAAIIPARRAARMDPAQAIRLWSTARTSVIELAGVRKRYNIGLPSEAEVLHGLDLRVDAGEFAALVGPSGSGKSTLLNIIGLLERMTSGSYRLQGQEVAALSDDELTLRRRRTLGFVFQFHHLLPAFDALENVTLPALAAMGRVDHASRRRALELLDAVGLSAAAHKRPGELSGGMQQRVAIARALVLQPALVLADEPTGNLDTASSDEVFALLRRIHAERGTAFIVVTHDLRLAARCDRLIEMVDGMVKQP